MSRDGNRLRGMELGGAVTAAAAANANAAALDAGAAPPQLLMPPLHRCIVAAAIAAIAAAHEMYILIPEQKHRTERIIASLQPTRSEFLKRTTTVI